jgi:heme-degrading monooxygenase HmoA
MYLRIYWSRITPGAWPAVEERYRKLTQADVPGRLVRWVTQDVNDPDSIITVTLWARREDIQAWEASEQYEKSVAAMKPFQVGSQTVSLCEVVLESPSDLLSQIQQLAGKPGK